MHRKHDVQAFSKHRQKHRRAMFLSEHRLNIPSLRNGKHPIVKNIPSLRKVKIPQPYFTSKRDPWRWDFVNGQMIVGPGARGALYGTLILPFTGRANCWRRIRNAYPTWDALQIHQLSKHVYVFCV